MTTGIAYACDLVHEVCCLAGSPSFLDDLRDEIGRSRVKRAVKDRDTPVLFDWLIEILSFQGISDSVASGFIARNGTVHWTDIAEALSDRPTCPKLHGYWLFDECKYRKAAKTCAQPSEIDDCPLPRHPLRNGRLNQMAYSLFLFMRDVARNDFVGWIDLQLDQTKDQAAFDVIRLDETIIGPLRNVYGVSDKVLAMALSSLMLTARGRNSLWFRVGAEFVVIDTLVHNFLHRTGILHRFNAQHPYGDRCYEPGGCASIVRSIASKIDAREFNPSFPATFPRFVQTAIWRYCAEDGLDTCNGNRIDDDDRCRIAQCQLFRRCDRVALRKTTAKNSVFTAV